MPTPRHRPPPQLHGRVFTTAGALAAGVGRHLLSGRAYRSWGTGLWCCADAPPDPRTLAGLQRILPALQGQRWVVSHATAAVLLGLRLPEMLERSGRLHLSSASGFKSCGQGVVGHKAELTAQDVRQVGATRVTAPTRTLLDLAAMRDRSGGGLLTQRQLVAVVDGVICEHRTGVHAGRPALRRLADLEADLLRFTGRRGAARLREAVGRAVVGVDSSMETYLRLVLEEHGLTGWETDLQISAPGHRPVCPDLADRRHRQSMQFDGAVHEDQRQRFRDVERQRATEAAGWTELRVVHTDLEPGDRADPGSEPRIVTLVRAHRAAFPARQDPTATPTV